jgi:Fur family ferric uptake transcriptional regulator
LTDPTHNLSTDTLRAEIRNRGLRATSSRIAVLRVLRKSSRPQSHAEVFDKLSDHAWDQATIYRNLTDLTEAGLLTRASFGDRIWRFKIADEPNHDPFAHPHFICVACGDVTCLPEVTMNLGNTDDEIGRLETGEIEVQLRGRCNNCG